MKVTPSIKSHQLCFQARALLCLCNWQVKCQSPSFFISSHSAAHGFWALAPPIVFIPANKTDQSLSDFQIGIIATAHATLEIEELVSQMRSAIMDTITSLQGDDGEVIPVLEVHDSLYKICNILGKAVSKRGLVILLVV